MDHDTIGNGRHSPQRSPVNRTPTPHGVVRGHVVAAVGPLRTRLTDPGTLDALSDEEHLSRSQLVRAFDATAGTSPIAHRVERMERLMVTTDLSIAEAARAVGRKNQFHATQAA